MISRGEVRWYRFQKPDKRRLIVILTRDSAIPYLDELTIAPITSTIRDIPSEVLLTADDGMPRDCVVNLDHVQTVSRKKIGPLLAVLGGKRMREVRDALLFALQCER